MNTNYNPVQKHLRSEKTIRMARNFLGTEHFSWIAMLFALVFFIMAGWIPDGMTNLLLPDGNRSQGIWQLLVAMVVFVFLVLIVKNQIQKGQNIKVRVEEAQTVKVLLIILSSIGRKDSEKRLLTRLANNQVVGRTDVDSTSWEMPIIALEHHLPRLEQLAVLTSQGDGGSHQQFSTFANLVKILFPGSQFTIKELTCPQLNFEDIAGVHELLDTWYGEAAAAGYTRHGDMISDLTGGQKTASIAVAMACLGEGRRFQYVSTTDKNVRSFDLVMGE